MSQNIGEYQVRGPQRGSRVGTWQTLAGPDGQPRGGLRLDTVPLDQAIADRLSETVRSIRALSLPGLNTLVGQVHDGQYLWLISDVPASPTLSALPQQIPAPVALLITVDIGEALAALHAANLAHGDVGPDTVIITADGRAKLIETGFAHAIAGTKPGPGHDVTGWVALTRRLAQLCGGNLMLLDAASQAEGIGGSAGLTTALAALTASAATVPGFGERSALALLASIAPAPSAPIMPSAPPSTRDNTVTLKLPEPAQGFLPGSAAVRPPSAYSEETTLSPEDLETRMGRRNEDVLRFGRGVASARPPQQQPQAPAWQGSTAAYPANYKPNRGRRRLISIMSGLITVVILAVVGWIVFQRMTPLEISGVTVGLAQPLPPNACNVQVNVVGTITSTGGGGSFSYRWVRSDGASTEVLTESVSYGATVTQVHLLWTISGGGQLKAVATLQVLSPQPFEAATEFSYSCSNPT